MATFDYNYQNSFRFRDRRRNNGIRSQESATKEKAEGWGGVC